MYLGRVHGHAGFGDDMAEVGHDVLTKSTLGPLDDETMFLQLGEDKVEVAQVLCP
jgi:hypothetical protein